MPKLVDERLCAGVEIPLFVGLHSAAMIARLMVGWNDDLADVTALDHERRRPSSRLNTVPRWHLTR